MNTIVVWVMLVYTHSGYWIPTTEFSSEKKCISAGIAIESYMKHNATWFDGNSRRTPKCIRIEK